MKKGTEQVIENLSLANQPEAIETLKNKISIEHETTKILNGESYDPLRNEEEINFFQTQHVMSGMEIGKRIYLAKLNEEHGNFYKMLERRNILPRQAQRYMAIYLKFSNASLMTHLGTTKMIAALSIPDEEIEKLEDEGYLIGIPKDQLRILSVREFQAEIKKWKKRTENVEKQNTEKDEKIAKLEKQLADIFNPYTDDLEKEVEKKCHDLFLQVKAKLLYVRNIADQIYEHPELFTEASRMQVVGFTDLILHVAAEFREDIYKHALSEVGEGIPCVERLRCTPIQGNWNPDLVPEAHDIEPAPDKPFTNKEN